MSKALFTSHTVEVKGLESTINWLKHVDPKLEKAMRKGLKEASEPVLRKARANASKIADDGTFASSMSIASRANGSQYVLKSTDPAAGVKELAKPGAVRRSGPGRGKVRVGVPRRANKPRAMVPAVEDSADEVKDRIDERLAEVLDEVNKNG